MSSGSCRRIAGAYSGNAPAGPGQLAPEQPWLRKGPEWSKTEQFCPKTVLALERLQKCPKRSSSEHKRPWPQRGPTMLQSGPILFRKRSEDLQKSEKISRKKLSVTTTLEKHCKYEEKVPLLGWAVQDLSACNEKTYTPQSFIETKPRSAISRHLQ